MRSAQHAHSPALARTVDEYQRVVNASFVPLRITAAGGGRFSGSISSVAAGDAVFSEVAASPQAVERTEDTISAGGSGFYKVSLLLSGTGELVQDGREITMRPGELAFYDTSRPYSLTFHREFRNVIMMFPKRLIEVPERVSDSLTAVSLQSEHGLASLVSGFIGQTAQQLEGLQRFARARLARAGVDLMNTMLAEILGADEPAAAGVASPLEEVLHYMREHLASPTLSPRTIAEAQHLSVRHLHALFGATGTTISRWIKERRLERCRDDLMSPELRHVPIAAIAAQWGFADASHFSRAFRLAYAQSPRQCRDAR